MQCNPVLNYWLIGIGVPIVWKRGSYEIPREFRWVSDIAMDCLLLGPVIMLCMFCQPVSGAGGTQTFIISGSPAPV